MYNGEYPKSVIYLKDMDSEEIKAKLQNADLTKLSNANEIFKKMR